MKRKAVKDMPQEVIIIKVLRDLKLFDLLGKEPTGEFKPDGYYLPFLNMLYVAGYEKGKKALGGHRKRKIELHVTLKDPVKFDSITEASVLTKESVRTIKRALHSGIPTKKNHVWKYVKIQKGHRISRHPQPQLTQTQT